MSSLVEINGCSASQILETGAITLASNKPLELIKAESLTIKLDTLAFPLSSKSPVLTHSNNPLWYFFKSPLNDGSYVRITLPEGSNVEGSAEQKLQDAFEDELIRAGLLKTGIEAAGDELGATVKEDAAWVSRWITSRVGSSQTHAMGGSAVPGAASASSYAEAAAGVFARTTIGFGEKLFNLFTNVREELQKGPLDAREKMHRDLAEAGYADDDSDIRPPAPAPVVQPAAEVKAGKRSERATASEGFQEAVLHDYGSEAANLGGQADQTALDVGSSAKRATADPSAGTAAAQPALKGPRSPTKGAKSP